MGQRLTATPVKDKRKIAFVLAVVLALILHGVFFLAAQLLIKAKEQAQKPITVRPISLRDQELPATIKKPEPKKKQVVSTPKPIESKRPEKAEFLAEHDNLTHKEMISDENSLTPKNTTARPVQSEEKSKEKINGQKKAGNRGEPDFNKVPSMRELAELDGEPFAESVENVQRGAQTSLNTWEWKHAAFFNRVKYRVAQNWSPNIQIKKFDPNGSQIGAQDRVTGLRITIDARGNLIEVVVIVASGVTYLDDEAVKAFRHAAPFANPPRQLFEHGDRFVFEFGFHFRYQHGFGLGFR